MIQSAVGLIQILKIAPKSQELFDSQECKITNWRNLQYVKICKNKMSSLEGESLLPKPA